MNSRRAIVLTLIEMLIAIAIMGLLLSALHATRQNTLCTFICNLNFSPLHRHAYNS
jgi:prepilin-type N-terminal cleavage/methylation domain-containing protein